MPPQSRSANKVPGRFTPIALSGPETEAAQDSSDRTTRHAFIPDPLPPAIDHSSLLTELHEPLLMAERALSVLEGAVGSGPVASNPYLLIGPFSRREAVASSAIEGTIASLEELALIEADDTALGEREPEVREVQNYVKALRQGFESDLPVCNRLIRDLHRTLMTGARGKETGPGQFRRQQNAIIERKAGRKRIRFIPPPVPEMEKAMADLETFLHQPSNLPRLVQLAMVHYQFETIHPFLDGNGRIGRLLITLLLRERSQLARPLVYLSDYFERHRVAYCDLLLGVSLRGEWFPWLAFFLEGVAEQATDARRRAAALSALLNQYRERIVQPRAPAILSTIVEHLFDRPAVTVRMIAEKFNVTAATAGKYVDRLERAGILKEATGRKKDRVWLAEGILLAVRENYPDEP